MLRNTNEVWEKTTLKDIIFLTSMLWFDKIQSLSSGVREKCRNFLSLPQNKKDTLLLQLQATGRLSQQEAAEFIIYVNDGTFSLWEIHYSLHIFFQTKATHIMSFLSEKDVMKKRGKKISLPRFVSDLPEDEKYILAYGIQTTVVTRAQTEFLYFENGETLETFLEKYATKNLTEVYFNKLINQLCTE